jgi:hypothetical protein
MGGVIWLAVFPQFLAFTTHKHLMIKPIPNLFGELCPAPGGKRVTSGASEQEVRKLLCGYG